MALLEPDEEIGQRVKLGELVMESRLSAIPSVIEILWADPEVSSRLRDRHSDLEVAVREALSNAVVHGNKQEMARHVYVGWFCEPDGSVSIVIRDEGAGFNPADVPAKPLKEDLGYGIAMMKRHMDEVRFQRAGTETYMRIAGAKS